MKFFRTRLAGAVPQRGALAARRGTGPGALGIIIGMGLLLLAMLLGAVVALDSVQLTVVLAGVLAGIPIMFLLSTRNLLPVLFIVVFLVQGATQTFFKMRLGTWFASGVAALFMLRALLEFVALQRRPTDRMKQRSVSADMVYVVALVYLAFFFFSLMLGHASVPQRISALRFGVPMFGILFALYWFKWPVARVQMMWWLLVAIVVFQLPVTIYQHFGPAKATDWDAVVGTFGTGMSPSLIIVTLAAMLYALARWHHGASKANFAVWICLTGLAVMLLGEVKAVVFWIPIGMFFILRRRIMKNVVGFFLFGMFVLVFVSGTFLAYKAMYWGEQGAAGNTIEEKLEKTGGYFFDTKVVNYRTGEISRGASLYLWYRDPLPSALERLVGYGPGASQSSVGMGKGIVAKRYGGLSINATALAQLLWDVGILGTIAFVLLILFGFRAGLRYVATANATPSTLAIVDASTGMLVIFSTLLIYNRSILDEPTMQLLFFFSLGCIVQYCRFGDDALVVSKASQSSAQPALA